MIAAIHNPRRFGLAAGGGGTGRPVCMTVRVARSPRAWTGTGSGADGFSISVRCSGTAGKTCVGCAGAASVGRIASSACVNSSAVR